MAKDLYHQIVRDALEKEGWTITDDPFVLKSGGLRMEVDLAAEKVIAATRENEKIIVEIKSFISKSKLNDFYEAKGQYDVYRKGLKKEKIEHKLFLAVEEDVYNSFFQKILIQEIVEEDQISLLIYNIVSKSIISWQIH